MQLKAVECREQISTLHLRLRNCHLTGSATVP